jgi:hypothetical protein
MKNRYIGRIADQRSNTVFPNLRRYWFEVLVAFVFAFQCVTSADSAYRAVAYPTVIFAGPMILYLLFAISRLLFRKAAAVPIPAPSWEESMILGIVIVITWLAIIPMSLRGGCPPRLLTDGTSAALVCLWLAMISLAFWQALTLPPLGNWDRLPRIALFGLTISPIAIAGIESLVRVCRLHTPPYQAWLLTDAGRQITTHDFLISIYAVSGVLLLSALLWFASGLRRSRGAIGNPVALLSLFTAVVPFAFAFLVGKLLAQVSCWTMILTLELIVAIAVRAAILREKGLDSFQRYSHATQQVLWFSARSLLVLSLVAIC